MCIFLGNEINPRSQPPRPTTSAAVFPNTVRVPHTSAPAKSMTNTMPVATAGQPARTINVKAVGRADFRSAGKTTSAGKHWNKSIAQMRMKVVDKGFCFEQFTLVLHPFDYDARENIHKRIAFIPLLTVTKIKDTCINHGVTNTSLMQMLKTH